MEITLGSIVTDSISGLTGVAMGRAEYFHGCVKVLVEVNHLVDGKLHDGYWLDEGRLTETDASGGPANLPPTR